MEVLVAPANAQHPDIVSLLRATSRRVIADFVPLKGVNIHDPQFQPWTSIGLVETLLSLSESPGLMDRVQFLLTTPLARCPEVLAFTLVKCDMNRGPTLFKLVLDALTKVFLEQSPNASVVLTQFFQIYPAGVLQSMVEYVGNERQPMRLARVLDVAQDIKALSHFLQTTNYRLAIEGAVMAAQRDFVNLSVWLQSRLQLSSPQFIMACLGFLQDRMSAPQPSLSLEVQQLFLTHLQAISSSLPAEVAAVLNKLVEKHLALTNPMVRMGGPAQAMPSQDPGTVGLRKEVKDAANSIFEQIYSEKMSIDACIAFFQNLQASANPVDREVFECMITSLFGEYRFLGQYPDKELAITANLVGVLVLHNLLHNQRLLELMQLVLDAISKDPGSNIYKFGIFALNRFRDRLREWPNYATRICQSPHFASFPEELKSYCLFSKAPPPQQRQPTVEASPAPFVAAPPGVDKVVPFITAPSNKDLVQAASEAEFLRPSPASQDQVSFVINNLSDSNVRDKAREIKLLLQPQYLEWFAH